MIRWAAAGAVVGGLLLGELPLVLLGLVLGGLALVSAAGAWAARQVTLEVDLRPSRVEVGQEARLHVVVTNPTPLPLPGLLVELELPRDLVVRGTHGRRTVAADRRVMTLRLAVGGRERVERTYVAVPAARGPWRVGPGWIEGGDLFGLDDARGERRVAAELLAVPRPAVVGLPALGRQLLTAGSPRPFALHEEADRVRGTRPYRPGDRLRDVHQRQLARTGVVAVLDRERTDDRRLTVLLDVRTAERPWLGIDGALAEDLIEAAAGVARSAVRAGGSVALLTGDVGRDGTGGVVPADAGSRQLGRILTALGHLSVSGAGPLEAACAAHPEVLAGREVVVISPVVDPRMAALFSRLRRLTRRTMLLTPFPERATQDDVGNVAVFPLPRRAP